MLFILNSIPSVEKLVAHVEAGDTGEFITGRDLYGGIGDGIGGAKVGPANHAGNGGKSNFGDLGTFVNLFIGGGFLGIDF